ncbi:MAG: nucleotidyltransferase domain-containing protein [Acidobacteria bacterium]|nr:nucleotidyltransferase domain-containing protein [Acidobacteriota bacterium]
MTTVDLSDSPVLLRLVEGLRGALGDELVSVVLYGSAARGDYDASTSDLNILIVASDLKPTTLARLSGPIRRWERSGQPMVRLLSPAIIRESADVFPIEFLDLQASHRVLHGSDPFATFEVELSHLRMQCERELREKMMRLREAYIEAHDAPPALTRLLTQSYSTFVALFRGCLRLHGDPVPAHNEEVAAAFARAADIDVAPFDEIAQLKHGEAPRSDLTELFARYYDALTAAVARINRFAPPAGDPAASTQPIGGMEG